MLCLASTRPMLLPLHTPRRRHANVPDALKNRLRAASLAKRWDCKASIIQPRPRRESPELSLVIPPVSLADPAPVASRVRSLRAHCARGWLTIAGMNERTATWALPWNNREGTNHHVSSNRHPEFLLAGPLLSADRAGQATAIASPRRGLLPGGRPGVAHPGRWAAVPPDRPARLPPRLAPRARRGRRQARRTRRAALRDSRHREEVADAL